MPAKRSFIIGADRNNPDEARAHLYEVMPGDEYELRPMCTYGWNRSDGSAFSILRGNGSARGTCKICTRRRDADLPALEVGGAHKTRWV